MSGTPAVNTVGPISQTVMNIVNTPPIVSIEQYNKQASDLLAINDAESQKLAAQKIKADAIDAYFKDHGMPLAGYGMKMVLEAEKNELDWRLLAAISVRESTGGIAACKKATNNPFGWASCKVGFESMDKAIETVAKNLGGNNPKTARHYDAKTTLQILRAYNPPSIVPRYAQQVISIMDTIGEGDEITTPPVATT